MKCPHCLVEFVDKERYFELGHYPDGFYNLHQYTCPSPSCRKLILFINTGHHVKVGLTDAYEPKTSSLLFPKGSMRPPAPPQVPDGIAEDYNEACLVLPDSPKASAALSRRCLQHIFHEHLNIRKANLSLEIDELIKTLPSHIAESLDAIRNIGNFSAHPNKSEHSGEIIDVEPGEAEWSLEVLELLFDFHFVKPAVIKSKRDKLNAKLKEAGKPEMK